MVHKWGLSEKIGESKLEIFLGQECDTKKRNREARCDVLEVDKIDFTFQKQVIYVDFHVVPKNTTTPRSRDMHQGSFSYCRAPHQTIKNHQGAQR